MDERNGGRQMMRGDGAYTGASGGRRLVVRVESSSKSEAFSVAGSDSYSSSASASASVILDDEADFSEQRRGFHFSFNIEQNGADNPEVILSHQRSLHDSHGSGPKAPALHTEAALSNAWRTSSSTEVSRRVRASSIKHSIIVVAGMEGCVPRA
ncbi:hypothetical protein FIBSPDRAFT_142712 [Athelia psychrophila]|uniref:Uncharacterized protein n=1 Tax=Athelia psychrophila TaxID=1759441 RepID=A0A166T0P9_9AGAM|nr:hypothetical protein FIBSPDRAFT_142712 [Fibularhizoctonia sp. CBS 109695]